MGNTLNNTIGFDSFTPYFRCGLRRTPVFRDPYLLTLEEVKNQWLSTRRGGMR